MPIYEYQCGKCGYVWEKLTSRVGEAISNCPRCGGGDVHRLLSAPNVLRGPSRKAGMTCCGRDERCETPPCSSGNACRRG